MVYGFLAAWREVKEIIMGLLAVMALGGLTRRVWLAGAAAGLLAWGAYFFRDPDRTPESALPGSLVSPADGHVTHIDLVDEPHFIGGPARRVSIFLSLFDVHVQRAACPGQVEMVRYQPGDFAPAFLKDTHSNESNLIGFSTPYGPIAVKQIAGILARRIVCRVEPGQTVEQGERLGLIKFGSRVDLLLPPQTEVLAAVGQKVYGGQTVVARCQ
jgi:phosphatidylserine decarboxylase